ncbi:hypothetical protein ACFC0C_34235 [Streptomyces sp. NPDC056178]|uniref:hypothetical protein n=1 Tax=unclassified Streptomyces TaxID=2593676 RepID=UPI0035E24190
MADERPTARSRSGDRLPAHRPVITYMDCSRCGTHIAGLDGRYACAGCGWVNDYSEGHSVPLHDR